jgi:hypothetical protein
MRMICIPPSYVQRLEYGLPGMAFIGFQSTIYSYIGKDVQSGYILLESVH